MGQCIIDLTGHALIDKTQHSSTVHVWAFRGADSNTDHYLVLEKVGDKLVVSKW